MNGRRGFARTDFGPSVIGGPMNFTDRVSLLAYRVVTTGRWLDLDLRGPLDGVTRLTLCQVPDHFFRQTIGLRRE